MSVNEILDRMEELSRRIGGADSSGGSDRLASIIGLRQEFTTECGNLLKAMCDDPRIFDNRAIFNELQEGLENMRARMSAHQLKWQGESIEQNPEAYRKASGAVNTVVEQFIANARARLGT